jgi:acetoin utilization protein AcuB
MNVEDVMTAEVTALTADQSLFDVIEMFRTRRIRHAPVMDEGRLIGVVTDRDVKRATPSLHSGVGRDEYERVLNTTLVSQIMTREPLTVTPQTPVKEALKILIDEKIGALPVLNGGDLVGIVTEIDMLRAFYATLE